ncbi:MAG: metal ABC transporter substrate-binding protein [Chloroflexota bacterium]
MSRLHLPLVLLALALAACAGADETPADGRLRVVTTVSPITSIVEQVGNGRIALTGIVPEGANSHTYEPSPSIARTLAEADLIVMNGLYLEQPALELAQANRREGVPILLLGDGAISRSEWVFDFSFPQSAGHPNPHLWTSPRLAARYAGLVADALSALDPANAASYAANREAFEARIDDLDSRIRQAVATVAPEHRKLLTYHDSFPFFGADYGFDIIGAVQPADFSEPSAREVAALIEQMRTTGVPAVFGSEVFPSPVMEQIAQEAGAEFVNTLRDDDLPGEPGAPEHSYLGLMAANVRTITSALGGDASALDGFPVGPVFDGSSDAVYPQ